MHTDWTALYKSIQILVFITTTFQMPILKSNGLVFILTLYTTGTLANSKNPDEMPHNVAFHQCLHCLLRQIHLQRKNYIYFLIIACDHSIYIMDHPDFIVCSFMESSIGLRRVKQE